jgi:transcriptional regulator with XRE-family HTH domain
MTLPYDWVVGDDGVARRRPHRRVNPKPQPLPDVDPRRIPIRYPLAGPFNAGAYLRRARQRIQVSQRELAWRARVSHATVSRAESGALVPSLAMLQRLLAVAGLHLVVIDETGRVMRPVHAIRRDASARRYPAGRSINRGDFAEWRQARERRTQPAHADPRWAAPRRVSDG